MRRKRRTPDANVSRQFNRENEDAALKQIVKGRLFAPSPRVLMHPLEMIGEGLSEIEKRTFQEVAIGAGAAQVVVWVGHELSDAEVKEKLGAK